jgi:hypothetical protein
VFLHDLFREYLLQRPSALKKRLKLRSSVVLTEETATQLIEQAGRPFQSISDAKDFLKQYLGGDLFKNPPIDLGAITELDVLRNAVVHRGGTPTR